MVYVYALLCKPVNSFVIKLTVSVLAAGEAVITALLAASDNLNETGVQHDRFESAVHPFPLSQTKRTF